MNVRSAAADVLHRVLVRGLSLSDALRHYTLDDAHGRPLLQELCYGSLRWYGRLAAITELLLRKPLRRKDSDIACLIWLGLYQLIYTRIPTHAAIYETVQVSKGLGKAWAGDLINAVLRNFERHREELLRKVDQNPVARLSHPRWLLDCLHDVYPQDWERICNAANIHAPMTLRVNQRKISKQAYLNDLHEEGIEARTHPLVESAIVLQRPMDVNKLKGFMQGLVSVQDAAAQLAAPLLDCRDGMRVLDACAAPGGKTAHLVEYFDGALDLLAIEKNPHRMCRLEETLARVGGIVDCRLADAAKPDQWWDGQPFDRILLDTPCSATGVIRRHPDIKWRRKPDDINAFVRTQTELITTLWELLKKDGVLLYVTCSILPQENHELIMRFIAGRSNARIHPLNLEMNRVTHTPWSLSQDWQILPGDMNMDGFYYAALRKVN